MQWKMLISCALMALLLTSCDRSGADSFCAIADPIYIDICSDDLTEKTADQIDNYDDVGAKLCGWKKHTGKPCTTKKIQNL